MIPRLLLQPSTFLKGVGMKSLYSAKIKTLLTFIIWSFIFIFSYLKLLLNIILVMYVVLYKPINSECRKFWINALLLLEKVKIIFEYSFWLIKFLKDTASKLFGNIQKMYKYTFKRQIISLLFFIVKYYYCCYFFYGIYLSYC